MTVNLTDEQVMIQTMAREFSRKVVALIAFCSGKGHNFPRKFPGHGLNHDLLIGKIHRHKLLRFGLRVAGCGLRVTGCELRVTGCTLFIGFIEFI